MEGSVIFGTRSVIEAVQAGKSIDKILIKNGLSNDLFGELYRLIREYDIPFQFVPLDKLNRITRKNHQGIIALLSPIELFKIEDLLPGIYERGEDPFILLLDGITDIRNFGAIIRTAECAGVHAVVVPARGAARIGEDAMKTSAGALNLVPVCKSANLPLTLEFLRQSGIRIVAATEKAEAIYTHSNLTGPLAVITGAEDTGITPGLLRMADLQVKIPLKGKIASLNVSVATSLILYEAVRQKEKYQE